MQQFSIPSKILMGDGIVASSCGMFRGYGKRGLIVTGKHVGKSTMMATLTEALKRDGVEFSTFDGITGEPTVPMIDEGLKAYRDNHCDFVIGIGGGSPLNSAKAIAAMAVNPGKIADYNGKTITGEIPTVVCIPTTAGTGSEATKFTIITDEKKDIKMLLKGDVLLPKIAIVDYKFGKDAPKGVTAATGLDALTHSIESYISVKAQPLTDVYALSAIKRIMHYLPIAYQHGDNAEARKEMAIAALEGGICINNSSVTVVHGMSRPIGALFHVPHGISNAMLLNVCLRDMQHEAGQRYAEIARYIGIDEKDDNVAAEKLLAAVADVISVCEVPTLQGYGIDEAKFNSVIAKMSVDAIASGSPANAPKSYRAEDLQGLYLKAFK
jgi:alcohol dehydrogenase class IV